MTNKMQTGGLPNRNEDRRKQDRRTAQVPFEGPNRRKNGDRRSGRDRRAAH